jgi:hypothetical protein
MAIEDCLQHPGSTVAIIGPTLKQTRDILKSLVRDVIIDAPKGLIRETKSELLWNVGTSQLVIAAFDTAIEAVRGRKFHNIYLEESGLSNLNEYDYTINSVLRPTLMHSRGKIIHLTTPAVEVNHPMHTKTMADCAANDALFIYTIEDNPLLTKDQIDEEIKAMGGRDAIHVRRELFCEIVKDVSLVVIPEFDDRHIKTIVLPSHAYYLTSIDFGGSMDQTGIVMCFYDFVRDKICIYKDKLIPRNTATKDVRAEVYLMEDGTKWLEGPRRLADAPGQIRIDLGSEDFYVAQPRKEKGSLEANINALRLAFTRDEMEVDPSCIKLIATLRYGSWLLNKEDWQRTPELGHLDLLAALLYAQRHIDTRNPYPAMMGKHKETHHTRVKDHESLRESQKIDNFLLGGD